MGTLPLQRGMRGLCCGYAIVMGAALLLTWVVLLATGQTTDFQTVPMEASFLLAAEVLTGLTLILGGYGSLALRSWGPVLHLVSLGMLLYATVYSIGVFGQAANTPAMLFFVVVSTTTVVVIILELGRAQR